ncbi:VrrA/YqfQ family protein [Paraliobacillus sp. JSM ZJ581]|uniref:VrrA/YqfQ family protein n=1 Tax=Paraliobacillus sp. JSM ZJ581 TaxID=3342118 RepID=UPI0035A93BAF
MFPPLQGRPPIQPNVPPMNMQGFQQWGAMPATYQPTTVAPRGGLQGIIQKLLPSQLGSQLPAATTGGGGITNTLSNIQQILKMTQSVTPIIQQYGPIVKNLPTMLSLLKAFQEVDGEEEAEEDTASETDESNEQINVNTNEEIENKSPVKTNNENIYLIETDKPGMNQSNGSKPKLFI